MEQSNCKASDWLPMFRSLSGQSRAYGALCLQLGKGSSAMVRASDVPELRRDPLERCLLPPRSGPLPGGHLGSTASAQAAHAPPPLLPGRKTQCILSSSNFSIKFLPNKCEMSRCNQMMLLAGGFAVLGRYGACVGHLVDSHSEGPPMSIWNRHAHPTMHFL